MAAPRRDGSDGDGRDDLPPLIVVGIAGVARSGKDTIARHLCDHHGFTRIALADAMRSIFSGLDGPTWELRKELEAAGKTSRWALQTFGTECREALPEASESLWCLTLLAQIRFLAFHAPVPRRRFAIPDIRFPHEPEVVGKAIESWGGSYETWKTIRPDAGLDGDAAAHKSETLVDRIEPHLTIINNGTLAKLRRSIKAAVDHRGR